MKRYLRHYLHSHSQTAQFMRFATVGVKVSLVDTGIVYLLHWFFHANLYLSRFISLSTAIMVGYLLHRYFTFGGVKQGCFYRQMAGHFGVHLTGGLINYGTFSLIIVLGHASIENQVILHFLPLIGIWVGGMIGLAFNYFFSSKLVFHTKSSKARVTP